MSEQGLRQLIDGELQGLIRLVEEANIAELEVEWGDVRVRIRKGSGRASLPPAAESPPSPSQARTITAPQVGLFRAAPPGVKGLPLQPGMPITAGQVVGAVETMNVVSEVLSEVTGRVAQVYVQDGQPVEYGQPLVEVESDSGGGDAPDIPGQ